MLNIPQAIGLFPARGERGTAIRFQSQNNSMRKPPEQGIVVTTRVFNRGYVNCPSVYGSYRALFSLLEGHEQKSLIREETAHARTDSHDSHESAR